MDTDFDMREPVTDSVFLDWLVFMGIDVTKDSLEDLKDSYEDEFYDDCYNAEFANRERFICSYL